MKFAIRDDDINYFTKPEMLEGIYSDVWNICPISLAVIPFVGSMKSPFVPENCRNKNKEYPIGENQDLVVYLKQKIKENKVSIMLHGYNHKDNNGYEFADEKKNERYFIEKIKKGKEYLEKIFCTEVTTFVPPHNVVSKQALKAISKLKLNLSIVVSFHFNKRPWNFITLINFLKRRIFKLKYKCEPPFVFDFKSHKEVRCVPLTPIVNFEFLKQNFDIAYKFNGVFCLSTHYWEFATKMKNGIDKSQKDIFNLFWNYVLKFDNITFTDLNKLFLNDDK